MKMINHDSEYLDYCNSIIEKLTEGGTLPIALNMTGYSLVLHQLVQAYYSGDLSQREEIKDVLKRSVDMFWTYLMPLNMSDDDNSILPVEFEGDTLITSNVISFHEGELQIALLLLKIAIILEDKKLFKAANLVAGFSKIKEDKIKEDTLTFDFKNGTIGIALLYQTIFFLTNENQYLIRADYWYLKSEKLVELFKIKNNNAIDQETASAFEAFKNPQNNVWRKRNFLEFEILLNRE